MSITKDIANYIARSGFTELPKDVVKLAKLLILDEIGCAFAGYRTDIKTQLIDYVKEIDGKPEATILGEGSKVHCSNSAAINTFMSNALDLDETLGNVGHPGAVCVWSALSVGEYECAKGKDIINSVVVGYEVSSRICFATTPSPDFRDRYWNASFLTFGSMASAAKILGLDEDTIYQAIGIAGLIAPLANVSLWYATVPLSPIKSAYFWQSRAGIESALLARSGFKGSPGILDKRKNGYWAGFSDRCDWDGFVEGLGTSYNLLKHLSFKVWPCCRWIHAGLDMLSEFFSDKEIAIEDIEEIIYKTSTTTAAFPPFHEPLPHYHLGKAFSVPWAFAMEILGYAPGADWFLPDREKDLEVIKLTRKVRVEGDPEINRLSDANPAQNFNKLIIKAKGKVFERQIDYVKGDPQRALTEKEVKDKFQRQATGVISQKQTERLIYLVDHLDEVDNVRDISKHFIYSDE